VGGEQVAGGDGGLDGQDRGTKVLSLDRGPAACAFWPAASVMM
jgi:hypothetical protein